MPFKSSALQIPLKAVVLCGMVHYRKAAYSCSCVPKQKRIWRTFDFLSNIASLIFPCRSPILRAELVASDFAAADCVDDTAVTARCLRPLLDVWEAIRESETNSRDLLFPVHFDISFACSKGMQRTHSGSLLFEKGDSSTVCLLHFLHG